MIDPESYAVLVRLCPGRKVDEELGYVQDDHATSNS
jgi:hypothetical protein